MMMTGGDDAPDDLNEQGSNSPRVKKKRKRMLHLNE